MHKSRCGVRKRLCLWFFGFDFAYVKFTKSKHLKQGIQMPQNQQNAQELQQARNPQNASTLKNANHSQDSGHTHTHTHTRSQNLDSAKLFNALLARFESTQNLTLLATQNNSELIAFCLSNPALKARFFTQIDSKSTDFALDFATNPTTTPAQDFTTTPALIFEKEKFLDFLKLRVLDSSYTRFSNKIGLALASQTSANLLKSDSHIVLNFPYKDCILKGAQSNDNDKNHKYFGLNTLQSSNGGGE